MKKDIQGKRVVVIGGGTGLSTMLKGIKQYTSQITAIVTVADNGGSSGKIREEMGIVPPGDIRNCLVALANTEPIMEKILQYRFTEGSLNGQNFGNLLIATLAEITGSFEEAVHVTSKVLAITGEVLPVTLEDVHLSARFEDGSRVIGETEIVEYGKQNQSNICHIELSPKFPQPTEKVIQALMEAELIILGPGSLYTSIIPNLLVKDISEYIKRATAQKIYIANIMTQPGETSRFSLEEHIEILEHYLGRNVLDTVVINNENVTKEQMKEYEEEGAKLLTINEGHDVWKRMRRIEAPLIKIYEDEKFIRHDPVKLAKCIFQMKD
ncbi:MAG: YvcK family protein [Cellulosilyticum sp.]|nr:YvcK family protein [Cellulosilyticum sp.]